MSAGNSDVRALKSGLLLILLFYCVSGARNLREAPSPSPSIDQESVLLSFAESLSNFQVQAAPA